MDKPIVNTTLRKEIVCYDVKGKKLKMLLEVSFSEFDPLQFEYSMLDQWIKSTLVGKTMFPEEAARLIYKKMYELTKEAGKDVPYTVHVCTNKHAENLNVDVNLQHVVKGE